MRALLVPIFAQLLFSIIPVLAQGYPSADQIINSLRPSGNLVSGGTRGLRIMAPEATAAPSVSLTVNFTNGSAELRPDAMHTLGALGQALASKELAAYRFRIEGHTDTVGSREHNRALSERRAEAVVAYITSKYGVDASRLQAIGMGEDGLLVPTPPQTPEPRNWRVQVVNLGA